MPLRAHNSSSPGDTYEDLADAAMRGVFKRWRGKSLPPPSERFPDHYVIQFDSWDNMIAELLSEVIIDARTIEEAARVLELSGRVQGLLTTGDDPLGGPYRTQIAALRRWLRARDHNPEPPIAPELVHEWLADQTQRYAPSSVRKSVAAVRSWHRALDLVDPTTTDEIKVLVAGLSESAPAPVADDPD